MEDSLLPSWFSFTDPCLSWAQQQCFPPSGEGACCPAPDLVVAPEKGRWQPGFRAAQPPGDPPGMWLEKPSGQGYREHLDEEVAEGLGRTLLAWAGVGGAGGGM